MLTLADRWHGGVPTDHHSPASHDPRVALMRRLARSSKAKMTGGVPASTGIGAPGTQAAPASLQRSPMSAAPGQQQAQSIPFTRGSALATMQDATLSLAPNTPAQIQLQTNAFLEYLIMDWELTTSGNSASVVFAADAPFSVISTIRLDDPAGQGIVSPITGYQLFELNKYLPDVECAFDPQKDPNYTAVTGSGGTGGSFSFRLVIPVEIRRRDALGAVLNSAANQRYLVTLSTIASFASLYTTAPTTEATSVAVTCMQAYWTSPPGSITTPNGAVAVNPTPAGLGTVGFVRYERHNEVSGGGTPQIQLNNVGDYISAVIFSLRNSSNARESTDWPTQFAWWVNDFQVHALYVNYWQRWMARYYGYTAAIGTVGGLDTGVFVLPFLSDMFDSNNGNDNFSPANQYLATDATTKLQIRGTTFGSGASYLEVVTRIIRPVSGATLFN